MRHSKIPIFLLVLIMVAAFATVSMAQERNFTVKLGHIKDQLSKDLNVNKDAIPDQVSAPIDVAANACGKSLVDLQKSKDTSCNAKTTSRELNKIILQQMRR